MTPIFRVLKNSKHAQDFSPEFLTLIIFSKVFNKNYLLLFTPILGHNSLIGHKEHIGDKVIQNSFPS